MDQIVERFDDSPASKLAQYLMENPNLRVVTMTGWVATDGEECLIAVFEPKSRVAS
jgi:hypothetical protein